MKPACRAWGRVLGWAVLSLALGPGCRTTTMKGTPFFSGEYSKPQSPPEERVNLWPVVYYHEPALSVLWPFLEFTDDHWALRPLVSRYGLDRPPGKRELNILWPIAQFDGAGEMNRIFPVYWGKRFFAVFPLLWHKGGERGYSVVFPLYWDVRDGDRRTNTLFPLWSVNPLRVHAAWPFLSWSRARNKDRYGYFWPLYGFRRARDGSTSLTWWLWPLGSHRTKDGGASSESAFIPVYFAGRSPEGSWWIVPPGGVQRDAGGRMVRAGLFPLFYRSRSGDGALLLTPLWLQQRTDDGALAWHALPLVYFKVRTEDGDRWRWIIPYYEKRLADGTLDHAGIVPLGGIDRGTGSWWSLLGFRNAEAKTTCTWLFGWKTAEPNGAGFVYPLTPLAGWHTGKARGGWLFPLCWHYADRAAGSYHGRMLLLGAYRGNTGSGRTVSCWPLFSWRTYGQDREIRLEGTDPESRAARGVDFWSLPICWYENSARRMLVPVSKEEKTPVIQTRRRHGVVPLWTYERTSQEDANNVNIRRGGTVAWRLYDWKRELDTPAGADAPAHDYYRTRVLWRLWHYERLNGDVSLDIFPGFTHDRKQDGYRKTSFLWRLYRNERAADGTRKLDLLFIPILR